MLCFLGLLQLCKRKKNNKKKLARWCNPGAQRCPQEERLVSTKKKKKKKQEKEKSTRPDLFTLSPASPRSLGFTLGFFRLSWLPRGLEATTDCRHWMTAAEARAAWDEVGFFVFFFPLKRQNRSGASRERRRGAQKTTSPSFKCHAPGDEGCLGQRYFYARLL